MRGNWGKGMHEFRYKECLLAAAALFILQQAIKSSLLYFLINFTNEASLIPTYPPLFNTLYLSIYILYPIIFIYVYILERKTDKQTHRYKSLRLGILYCWSLLWCSYPSPDPRAIVDEKPTPGALDRCDAEVTKVYLSWVSIYQTLRM